MRVNVLKTYQKDIDRSLIDSCKQINFRTITNKVVDIESAKILNAFKSTNKVEVVIPYI